MADAGGAPGASAGQGAAGANGAAGAGAAAAANAGANSGGGVNGGQANNQNAGATGGDGAVDWTKSITNEELRGYATNKGWKSSEEAINSYRNFEKLQGVPQERILRLPEKADDPAWQDIGYKLGVPRDPKEYQFEVPKELGDENFATVAKDWFHKNGVPKTKAEAIVKSWNEYVAKTVGDQQTARTNAVTQQADALKKEWGAAHDQNRESALRAARAFWPANTKEGFDTKVVDSLQGALGLDGTLKFLHSLQTKIGEDSFVGGSQNNSNFSGVMTPAQAKDQIALRKKDLDFTSKLQKGDMTAKDEWTKLHKMAFPDQY